MKAIILLALVAAVFAVPQDINSNLPPTVSNQQQDIQSSIDKITQSAQTTTDGVASANTKLAQLETIAKTMEDDLDTMWLVLGAALVFLLNIGFGLIEAAGTRRCSLNTILVKNLVVCGVVAIMWWSFGYGVAYAANPSAETDNAFIGNGKVFMANDKLSEQREFANWVYSYAYAVLATTIATSALTDRGTLTAYVAIAIVFSGGIYPVIVHWVWASNGWLSVRNVASSFAANGMIDWSGSGVLFLNAGSVALVSSYLAGPRLRRFDSAFNKANPGRFQSGNKVYQGLGTIFLWVGFYGLTCVSSPLSQGRASLCVKVAANTTLAAAAGAIIAFLLDAYFGEPTVDMVHLSEHPEDLDSKIKRTDMRVTLNGVVAGLVAVSAGVSTYEPWAAVVVGIFGGIIAFYGPQLIAYLSIDDPVESFSLFGLTGFWGLMAVGWYARQENAIRAYNGIITKYGIWYGADAEQWGVQSFGGACILLWALVTGGILVFVLRFLNLLRVPADVEARGINCIAYNAESTKDQEMTQK
jgi:Amt family ammonium transporter